MAKRGGFPGGMPGNMANIMKQAQKMQKQMEEAQKNLDDRNHYRESLIFGEVSRTISRNSPETIAIFAGTVFSTSRSPADPGDVSLFQWKKLLSRIFKSSENHGMHRCGTDNQ